MADGGAGNCACSVHEYHKSSILGNVAERICAANTLINWKNGLSIVMQIVPVNDTPNQTLNVSLGGQAVTLNIYSTADNVLYMDVLVNNSGIIYGVVCENLNRIVRSLYLGFVGDFIWNDTHGKSDPSSPGLGTRYQLIYLSATDLNGAG